VMGGKYPIRPKERISVLIRQLEGDKDGWGENGEEFYGEGFEDRDEVAEDGYKGLGKGERVLWLGVGLCGCGVIFRCGEGIFDYGQV
ncbi:cytochrome P450, partial [Bacillus velezensis]|uniref:cytochrome P450 n=1 Tax=Bacillus velezensis TaxID=492670 RepID=UPI001C931343